jgi:FkbM family methyltransferase
MGFEIRRRLERGLDAIFPKARAKLARRLAGRLAADPLHVIDIGGALGPDPRWGLLPANTIRFMTFEPDARSREQVLRGGQRNLALAIGLAETAGERNFYLTDGPFASSLYPPNETLLRNFGVWPWYAPAGQVIVAVDTLDACLARHKDWRADFVKVDVEGADLEVLKGGRGALRTAFGVQIEVSFMDRNVGAPLQPEVDLWLREAGFRPHLLIREHWVRANGVYGALSRPQLAWGDAVYFRERDWVLARLAAAKRPEEAEAWLAVILAILLAYGAHDYAAEIVAAARDAGVIEPEAADAAAWSVNASLMALTPFVVRGALALLLAVLIAAPLALFGGRGRSFGRGLIAAQAVPLFDTLSQAARRGGINCSCLPDL